MNTKTILALASTLAVSAALSADPVTVDNVNDLATELNRLNRTRDTSATVILKKGFYDVSSCAMEWDNGSSFQTSDSHLAVSHLTLKGETSNPRDTVIYGNRTARILRCYGGQVEGLTISNGYSSATGGGVLCIDTKATTLTNVVVTCCESADVGGGLRYATYVRDCQLIGNRAKSGGGTGHILTSTFPDAGVYGGVIRGNESLTTGGGGAICASLYGVRVENNRAATHGGGVFNNAGQVVRDCTIVSNTAGGSGGGVYIANNSQIISNSVVAFNSCNEGGGGGIILANNTAWAYDCIVSNNVATGKPHSSLGGGGGGGVLCGYLSGCTIVGNRVTNNTVTASNANGGGILNCVLATNCTIVGNYTVNRGGGAAKSHIVSCLVSNNIAQCGGGGIYKGVATASRILLNKVENIDGVVNNEAHGAGAHSSFVTNSVVAGNAGVPTPRIGQPYGGGGYDSEFYGGEIRENFAAVGGAMYKGRAAHTSFRDNATISGTVIFRNTTGFTDCDIKGAILDWPGYLVNCRVHDYRTEGYATIPEGANAFTSGVFNCMNVKSDSPNLLYSTSNAGSSGMAATNTIFYNNNAASLFWPAGIPATFINCQFVSNKVSKTCIGVSGATSVEYVNTIFSDNMSFNGSESYEYWPNSSSDTNAVMRNCVLGTGSRRYLPNLVENTSYDVRIRFKADEKWPCMPSKHNKMLRGNGLVQDWMSSVGDVRGAEYPRLRDGKVDIGAYQNWDPIPGMTIDFR